VFGRSCPCCHSEQSMHFAQSCRCSAGSIRAYDLSFETYGTLNADRPTPC
jgi:hypothetical protein